MGLSTESQSLLRNPLLSLSSPTQIIFWEKRANVIFMSETAFGAFEFKR
jgi:hypothetical protein